DAVQGPGGAVGRAKRRAPGRHHPRAPGQEGRPANQHVRAADRDPAAAHPVPQKPANRGGPVPRIRGAVAHSGHHQAETPPARLPQRDTATPLAERHIDPAPVLLTRSLQRALRSANGRLEVRRLTKTADYWAGFLRRARKKPEGWQRWVGGRGGAPAP